MLVFSRVSLEHVVVSAIQEAMVPWWVFPYAVTPIGELLLENKPFFGIFHDERKMEAQKKSRLELFGPQHLTEMFCGRGLAREKVSHGWRAFECHRAQAVWVFPVERDRKHSASSDFAACFFGSPLLSANVFMQRKQIPEKERLAHVLQDVLSFYSPAIAGRLQKLGST